MPDNKLTILKSTTATQLVNSLGSGARKSGVNKLLPTRAGRVNDAFFGQIVSDDGGGYYTVKEVIRDDSDADNANHTWRDIADTEEVAAFEVTGATGIAVDEVFLLRLDITQNRYMWMFQQGGGGGLEYATSPNTTLDPAYTFGATFDEPAGTGTALETGALFYLSTPWNTRITAPTSLFSWWNKVGNNYYIPVTTFYIKLTAQYPTSGGATTFTAYYNDSATFSLGTNTAFPAGVEVKLNGFNNASASADVRSYFNGQTFIASYDTQNNIIYITHPRY